MFCVSTKIKVFYRGKTLIIQLVTVDKAGEGNKRKMKRSMGKIRTWRTEIWRKEKN